MPEWHSSSCHSYHFYYRSQGHICRRHYHSWHLLHTALVLHKVFLLRSWGYMSHLFGKSSNHTNKLHSDTWPCSHKHLWPHHRSRLEALADDIVQPWRSSQIHRHICHQHIQHVAHTVPDLSMQGQGWSRADMNCSLCRSQDRSGSNLEDTLHVLCMCRCHLDKADWHWLARGMLRLLCNSLQKIKYFTYMLQWMFNGKKTNKSIHLIHDSGDRVKWWTVTT